MGLESYERYTLAPMKRLWNPRTKFQYWHKVECALIWARAVFGELQSGAFEAARDRIEITNQTVKRIKTLEKDFDHDMICFVLAVKEQLGDFANEYHKEITSYDIEDPALILMLREAIDLILKELYLLEKTLRKRALEHKWTLMIARTHGQFAEPTTFGHLLMVYAEAIGRSTRRLKDVLEKELNEGKMSGPVGVYGSIDPRLAENAIRYMGLEPAKAETQILQRDRHATALAALTVLAGTIEQMARTFWEMMRSDTQELREPRKPRQRGSSSMAWKRNPILMERLQGLPSLVRGFLLAQMEQIATPEFRDISQSIVERTTFADTTSLVHYAVVRMTACVERLEIYPERMKRNLENTHGVWAGQLVQTALMDAGVPYNIAYEYIQRAGFKAVDEETPMIQILRELPLSDEDQRTAVDILGYVPLANFFNPVPYIRLGIEHIFREPS